MANVSDIKERTRIPGADIYIFLHNHNTKIQPLLFIRPPFPIYFPTPFSTFIIYNNMLPKSITTPEKENKEVLVPSGSRNIAPHVANLIITNLKDVAPDWWDEIKVLLTSKNILDRKFAVSEINKLQLKVMPTELKAGDGDGLGISVNIVQYGNPNTTQLHPEALPGATTKSDGRGDAKGSGSVAPPLSC